MINIPKVNKLPSSASWFSYHYKGAGENITNKFLNKKTFEPSDWKSRFPKLNYSFPELDNLLDKLNSAKNAFWKNKNIRKINFKINTIRNINDLLGKSGELVRDYNAEIASNAWAKMWEICNEIDFIFEKKKNSVIKCIHFAEAPGNFILSINHYTAVNYPRLVYEWRANTAVNTFNKKIFVEDDYNLIEKTKNSWWFGADNDGDVTSINNVKTFAVKAKAMDNFHIATGDAKYVPADYDYDKEEMINVPVIFGEILSGLLTLQKSGVLIIKAFTICTAPMVCFIQLLSYCFTKVRFFKPDSSRTGNSEIYIISIGFKDNLTRIEIIKLLNYLKFIRDIHFKHDYPCLFTRDSISPAVLKFIINFQEKMVNTEIAYLKKLDDFLAFKTLDSRDLNFLKGIKKEDWLKKYNMKKLPKNKQILN